MSATVVGLLPGSGTLQGMWKPGSSAHFSSQAYPGNDIIRHAPCVLRYCQILKPGPHALSGSPLTVTLELRRAKHTPPRLHT